MNELLQQISDSLDLETLQRIDQRCLEFEQERRRGVREIQHALRGFHGDARRLLLYELLMLDLAVVNRIHSDEVLDPLYATFADDLDLIELALQETDRKRRQESTRYESDTQVFDMETRIPERLGRYQLLSEIGRGGMGRVFRALDTRLNREVALKVPRQPQAGSDDLFQRFRREATTAAALQHPGLCPVLDVDRKEGILFQTSALIHGQSLEQMIKAGTVFPRLQAVEIVAAVADAMAVAHRAGVVHRDLKPSNVMLTVEGHPVVIDFGLAKFLSGDESFQTLQGTPVGTLSYMPPEQIEGRMANPDPRSDIYSLGILLYQLLCGRVPFEGRFREVWNRIVEEAAGPPSRYRRGIPSKLDAICLRAIAKLPVDRFQTMTEFAAELRQVAQLMEQAAEPRPTLNTSRVGRDGSHRWVLGITLVTLVAAAFVWFGSSPEEPEVQLPPRGPNAGQGVDDPPIDKAREFNLVVRDAPEAKLRLSGAWKLRGVTPGQDIYLVVEGETSSLVIDSVASGKFVVPVQVIATRKGRDSVDRSHWSMSLKVSTAGLPAMTDQLKELRGTVELEGKATAQPDWIRATGLSWKAHDESLPNDGLGMQPSADLSCLTDEALLEAQWAVVEAALQGTELDLPGLEGLRVQSLRTIDHARLVIRQLGQPDSMGELSPLFADELRQAASELPVLQKLQREIADAILKAGGDVLVGEVHGLPQIVGVCLNGCRPTADEMEQLIGCPSLRWLDLAWTELSDDALRQVAELAELEGVRLTGTTVSPDVINELRGDRPQLRLVLQLAAHAPQAGKEPEQPALDLPLLDFVPADADGLSIIRDVESFSEHVDFYAVRSQLLGAPDLLSRAIRNSGLSRGWDRHGDLFWVYQRRPNNGGLSKLVFLPTEDFKDVCSALRARRDVLSQDLWKFQIGKDVLYGKDLPGTGFSVYAFAADKALLAQYRKPVQRITLPVELQNWIATQEVCLMLNADVLQGLTADELGSMVPLLQDQEQRLLGELKIAADLIREAVSSEQGALVTRWAVGARLDPAVGVVASSHASLSPNELLAQLPTRVGHERDRILLGLPDDRWLGVIGGPVISFMKDAARQAVPDSDEVGAELVRAAIQFIDHAESLTLCVRQDQAVGPTGLTMLLGSDNTKQLMVSIESLLRETVALINAGAGPDQPVLVRLLKDIRGQFETLNLRVEIPDEEHKALGGLGPFLLQGDHRDLFVSAVSGELVAAVLDSQDDLQQIRTATQVGGLVSNPLVQPSLQMVPPTSQWLLLVNSHETVRLVLELLRDAAIEPVDLAKLGESSPLILGVELRPTFFEVTVGVHVSTFEMLGVWISKVVGEAIQRQVEIK